MIAGLVGKKRAVKVAGKWGAAPGACRQEGAIPMAIIGTSWWRTGRQKAGEQEGNTGEGACGAHDQVNGDAQGQATAQQGRDAWWLGFLCHSRAYEEACSRHS